MKIGLFPIDSKYHNLVLMKLSTWHKQKGDEVEFYKPLWHSTYSKIYCSKIFIRANKNDNYRTDDMIYGGSGIDIKKKLPEEIEHTRPDYSLYNLNYSLGFTTRGCNRNCKFCVVRQKEGYIKEHAEVEEFMNPKSNIIILLDNNFLALPSHIKKLQLFIDSGWVMDFNQGLDIRLINEENAKLLRNIKHLKQIRFSWDLMNYEKEVKEGLKILFKTGVKPYRIMVYTLCNFNTSFEEDMYRFEELINLGVDPFIMIYENGNKKIRDFGRWVNRRLYKVCDWQDYDRRTDGK
ncbi:MAG: radical SAM protein [Candidatus Marinimicrobia bacterium]|nr:radical SAM protein [Candidatus Neomarinimicrobiota bacterium]